MKGRREQREMLSPFLNCQSLSLTSQCLSSGSLSGTKGTSLIDLEVQKSLLMLPLLSLLHMLLLLRRGDERGETKRAAR